MPETDGLDPQATHLLGLMARARGKPLWECSVAEARAAYRRSADYLDIPKVPLGLVRDLRCPTRDGQTIAVRLYRGAPGSEPVPLVVYYHGGGFVIGDLETHDAVCRMLAAESGCAVLAVDYRLGPEHRFPTAVEDAWDAFIWAREQAAALNVRAERMAVAGDSAGGTLAAVTALAARDAGVALAFQVLIYPGTLLGRTTASRQRLTSGYLLDAPLLEWFFSHYHNPAVAPDWRRAPLEFGQRFDGLAPAHVVVAGFDPLHDEGVAYAEALRSAGVEVTLSDYPGMIHGFFNYGGYLDAARRAHQEVVAALRSRLF